MPRSSLPNPPPFESPLPTLNKDIVSLIGQSVSPLGTTGRFVDAQIDPPSRSAEKGLLNRLLKRNSRATVVAPTPLTQAVPELPQELRWNVTHEVRIGVRVFVNATGDAHYAEFLSGRMEPNRDLAAWAVFAARRWRFSPATSNGVAVSF
jgi:hypothetical protein